MAALKHSRDVCAAGFTGVVQELVKYRTNHMQLPPKKYLAMAPTTISSLPADCLLDIFSALPLRDLISCQRVCKTWNKLIKTKHLWKYVSFEGMGSDWMKVLKAHDKFKKWKTKGIKCSDLTEEEDTGKLLLFLGILMDQLRHLHFGVLPTGVLNYIIESDHLFGDLESLTVDMLTTLESRRYMLYLDRESEMDYFDIGKCSKLLQLRELKIVLDREHVTYSTFSFHGGLSGLGNLRHLRKLCLTSFQEKDSDLYDFNFLSHLTQLVQLQLGDATCIPPEVFKLLSELRHLRQLSLYNGNCTCSSTPCQCQWVDAIGKITNLVELELDFVHTIPRLNKSLLKMKQLRSLTIVPLKTDVTPNTTAFTVKDAKESTIPDVLEGLTWLRNLTWGVHCPIESVELDENNHMQGNSSTLTAVKERIQQCLPNTVILILPVLKTEDDEP